MRNVTRNVLVAHAAERARTLWQRMRGLLGRQNLPPGHALWIDRCKSVHTHFMRFPIDVVFLTREGRVIRTYENMKPFRITSYVRDAQDVLELPAGTLATVATHAGDLLLIEEIP